MLVKKDLLAALKYKDKVCHLEAFLEQMDFLMVNTCKNIKDALAVIKNHCCSNPYIEVCGFIGYDQSLKKHIVQLEKNCSTDPKNFFAIDALKYLLFKQKYLFGAIFHSHIIGDEKASEFDIKMSENCCIPFLIYGLNTDNFEIYQPKNIECDVKILKRIKSNI
jgi:proteasome lid subunit RPN8/RPN11